MIARDTIQNTITTSRWRETRSIRFGSSVKIWTKCYRRRVVRFTLPVRANFFPPVTATTVPVVTIEYRFRTGTAYVDRRRSVEVTKRCCIVNTTFPRGRSALGRRGNALLSDGETMAKTWARHVTRTRVNVLATFVVSVNRIKTTDLSLFQIRNNYKCPSTRNGLEPSFASSVSRYSFISPLILN